MSSGRLGESIGIPCSHCGLAVPSGRLPEAGSKPFCCGGCETAYQVLNQHGLGGYYELPDRPDRPARGTGRGYEEFDHPAFVDLYVRSASDGRSSVELYLEGVRCASCVWLIERAPILVSGVVRAELDIGRSLARIEWDAAAVPLSEIARTLDRLGYSPHPFRGVGRDQVRKLEDRKALIGIGVAGAIAGNVMLPAFALYAGDANGMEPEFFRLFRWVSMMLTVPALLFPGRIFFTGALVAIRSGTLHMDLPIALALAFGFTRGAINTITDSGPVYFDGVTALVFLLLVGRFLQLRSQRSAADSAELLFSLTPDSAHLVEDGTERDVPIAALVPEMEVAVRAGESFPADGVVREGTSEVDTALLTGESHPVVVAIDSEVFAGSLNLTGPLLIRVTEAGESTRVAHLMDRVAEGARRRAPVVALADRMAGGFVAVVLFLAALTFAIWVGRDSAAAWDHAIALLIVTCPCALALATPLAVTAAVGRAAAGGILIKGGDVIERLSRPGTLVLDKTGTLTAGAPVLVEWDGGDELLAAVVAVETGVSHPIAGAFRRAGSALPMAEASEVEHRIGQGVIGYVGGKRIAIGSPRWVAEEIGGAGQAESGHQDGELTPVHVAVDGKFSGRAAIGDRIRPDVSGVLDRLRAAGWSTVLLSGDHPEVVTTVGGELGFDSQDVIGGASPERKVEVVDSIITKFAGAGPVVMVGDGVNDAAAMSRADVGVGVHGGAEACLATADVYLSLPGLESLELLMTGSLRTIGVIRRNIGWALGYNIVGVTLAMTGVLSPLVAAVMMPTSSLTVILASWLSPTFSSSRDNLKHESEPTPSRLKAAA